MIFLTATAYGSSLPILLRACNCLGNNCKHGWQCQTYVYGSGYSPTRIYRPAPIGLFVTSMNLRGIDQKFMYHVH